MPRITPIRLLLLIPLLWFTPFLLYVSLPFPHVSPSARPTHIQHTLTSGGKVTTVTDCDSFYGLLPKGFSYPGCGYGVEWRLSLIDRALFLGLGAAQINLTNALRHGPGYESAPFKADVISGDDPVSKVIIPTWFPYADSVLFDSADHSAEEKVGLRAKVVEAGRVEVWADPWFLNEADLDRGREATYPTGKETTLLVALSVVEAATAEDWPCLSQVRVQDLAETLTSGTYRIRKWLLWNFEGPIFINFYICVMLIMPKLALETSWLLILPIVIGYALIGAVLYFTLRKPRNELRKMAGGGGMLVGNLKLPVWMKKGGVVHGIEIGHHEDGGS
ncbi:hypothetical protein DV737_g462, partial [Chaetothyriales sp. CBS 132003]